MPRFSLRTLIVVMLVGGPVLAAVWWFRGYWEEWLARALITGAFAWIGFGLLGAYLFVRWVQHLRVF